ncbi:hypothetical protein CDD82_3375 [Ophiocordyceps australis]|uniref:Uncharacterized protein n=1 Tax=Ophiocordyceps australis TaxID=1399860 RepID=A0A2C5Z9R1_9HYPO|nr:hypothetical protein CDD82_3375 [Ophiocordyceps australis]
MESSIGIAEVEQRDQWSAMDMVLSPDSGLGWVMVGDSRYHHELIDKQRAARILSAPILHRGMYSDAMYT